MFRAGGQHIFWAFETGAEPPSSKPHFEQLEGFHLLENVVLHFGQAPYPLSLQVAINHLTAKSQAKNHSNLKDLEATNLKNHFNYTIRQSQNHSKLSTTLQYSHAIKNGSAKQ